MALPSHHRFIFLQLKIMAKGRKTGGRTAGTPNKKTAVIREMVTNIVESYANSEQIQKDIAELEPKDRLLTIVKLAEYVIPKLQATTLDVAVENKKTIEDKLIELAEDNEDNEE